MKKRILSTIFLFLLGCSSLDYRYDSNQYKPSTKFEEYYQEKLSESKALNVRPGCEEKLTRYSATKTKYAILYVHGFGACRKEGEYTVDRISKKYKFNTYFIRQPGHGTNKEDHRDTTYNKYLEENQTALREVQALGDKVIVIGTSMGGLISTYLSAENPDKIHALVLVSPFYDFASSAAKILEIPGGYGIAYLLYGSTRKSGREATKDPEKQKMISEDYGKYWYTEQYISAIYNVIDLKDFIAKPEVYEKIKIPVLMFYYEKDEKDRDKTASVPAMLEAYPKLSTNSLSTLSRIENGAHVLMSEFVQSDKEKIEKALIEFIDRVVKEDQKSAKK
jgi:pimeloyl-ACP methyl ester carboxylesterase